MTETQENGGDLGIRSLSELNPKTRAVVEPLAPNAYSQPYETESGLHIFRVDERDSPGLTEAEKAQITVNTSSTAVPRRMGCVHQ